MYILLPVVNFGTHHKFEFAHWLLLTSWLFLQCGQRGAEAVQGQQAQDVVLLSAVLKAVPWRRGHELLREACDVLDRQRLVCGAVMR